MLIAIGIRSCDIATLNKTTIPFLFKLSTSSNIVDNIITSRNNSILWVPSKFRFPGNIAITEPTLDEFYKTWVKFCHLKLLKYLPYPLIVTR